MNSLIDRYWHGFLKRPYRLKSAIDSGKGQTVVLLHGIASSGESWKYVVDELNKEKYRIVALDLLGFGKSPQPNWLKYSVEDHARSVLLTLSRMRVSEPFILVGHSMGSLVAAEIAHAHPKKVKHLILHQMPMYNPEFSVGRRNFTRKTYRGAMRFIAEHPQTTLFGARMLGGLAASLGGFTLTKDGWYPFEMSLRNTILQKTSRTIHTLTMPTDVIYGRYDILVLRKHAEQFFAPSDQLRFYQINEIHRVSVRSGRIIAELIRQNTAESRSISSKYAKILIPFIMTNKYFITPKKHIDRKLALLLSGLFSAAFLVTALAAYKHTVTGWELQAFQAINVWQAPDYVTTFARVLSNAVWAIVGLVAILVVVPKTRVSALRIAVPTFIIYAVGFVLERIIDRARPDVLLHSEAIIRAVQDGPGFTSGHMLASTAIVFVLWTRITWLLRVLLVLLLVLEAWARVFLGVHFPLDVIGGVLLALAVGFALYALPAKVRTILRFA